MKKSSFSLIAALAVLAVPVPAFAFQDATPAAAVQVKKNQTLVDANGKVLGKVNEVNTERGTVTISAQMKLYRVPLSSISADGSRIKTTMTKKDLGL